MTKLRWDQVGERRYETGIDRGVLYLPDRSGVPWSGLTGLSEDLGDDGSSPRYFDGVKFLDEQSFGDYSATLRALMYPDEFMEFEGTSELGNGLYVGEQSPKQFHLSYRTRVGNDIHAADFGYKIHIIYNLTATPENQSFETLNESPSAMEFSWRVTGMPQHVEGYRPTAHVIMDSTLLGQGRMRSIESVLYGTDTEDAYLPDINELIDLVVYFDPRLVIPDEVTGLAELDPGMGDLTETVIGGVYTTLPTTRLIESDQEGFYHLDD